MEHRHTNGLIGSTSPYLLQHAHNPVDWHPWSDAVIETAKKENKLILVSIGYAACHWCHVMEHESFEDEAVAKTMNENFVCVKVDREERPDVDHYYMTAVQLMQQQGGWPLNVIALPDGRPIWGGTYFPRQTWVKNISAVADFYRQNPEKTNAYAEELQRGIHQVSLVGEPEDVLPATRELLQRAVAGWKSRLDMENGGRVGQPKFPMPTNLEFLLYYGIMNNDKIALNFVETTLGKMARGGIYDQIGGGFARYSVDEKWKVPHFEKMLYDNGQLLSIYSKGFQQFGNPEFKTVVYETVDFIERELMDASGAFYSSLDADSEGEEGKFYVWKNSEIEAVLKSDHKLFAAYYNVGGKGFWERGNNILLRTMPDERFAQEHGLTLAELRNKVAGWKEMILRERAKRERPGLDDKSLTAWNALVINGLVDAYQVFQSKRFLDLAIKNANFLVNNVMHDGGKLFRNWKNGQATIDGFLEDYALSIQAFIALFQATGNADWLERAAQLTDFVFANFNDKKSGLFYFSEISAKNVLTNHFQNEDNVIPAANSLMANNLHRLYLLLGKPEYHVLSEKMLEHITPLFSKYPMAYSNWGNLMLKNTEPYFEVAVAGEGAGKLMSEMQQTFHPNVLWAFTEKESEIPLLKDRFVAGENFIYVCEGGVCRLPVKTSEEALTLLQH